MTQHDKEQLKLEIDHIFESGANEIRIFEMVVNFIDSRNGVNKNFVLADVTESVALLKFLKEEQQKQYADAKDYMTANQHQYYEEGCDAVLQLIEMRFGN